MTCRPRATRHSAGLASTTMGTTDKPPHPRDMNSLRHHHLTLIRVGSVRGGCPGGWVVRTPDDDDEMMTRGWSRKIDAVVILPL